MRVNSSLMTQETEDKVHDTICSGTILGLDMEARAAINAVDQHLICLLWFHCFDNRSWQQQCFLAHVCASTNVFSHTFERPRIDELFYEICVVKIKKTEFFSF